jgi:hypothetical protein
MDEATKKLHEVNAEVKKGVVEIYEDLLMTIWFKIVPTLGVVTVVTILKKAVAKIAVNHPFLQDIEINETGISLSKIKAKLSEEDKEQLKVGFRELVVSLFDILAKLTGNILVQQLMKEVEGLEV